MTTSKLRKPGNGRFPVAKPIIAAKFKDGNQYGVEIEVEGRRLPRENWVWENCATEQGFHWATHQDGSLRGESCEYVFEGAVPFKDSLELIDKLFEGFKACNSQLVPSNRTSTHVHVNVSGLKVNALNAIIALWFTLEEAVINVCGELRKNNHFCLSAKESSYITNVWERALETGRFSFSNDQKYAALNLAALNRFGTLEFRCFPMPTKADDVTKWVKFLHGLKQVATTKYLDNSRIGRDLSERGPLEILLEICMAGGCGDLYQEFVKCNPDIRASAMEGFRTIQETVYAYDWPELVDECNREYVADPFAGPGYAQVEAPAPRQQAARVRARGIHEVADAFPPPPPMVPDQPPRQELPDGWRMQDPDFERRVQEELIRMRLRGARMANGGLN